VVLSCLSELNQNNYFKNSSAIYFCQVVRKNTSPEFNAGITELTLTEHTINQEVFNTKLKSVLFEKQHFVFFSLLCLTTNCL